VFDFDNNQIGFGAKPTVGNSSSTTGSQTLIAESAAGSIGSTKAKAGVLGALSLVLSILFLF